MRNLSTILLLTIATGAGAQQPHVVLPAHAEQRDMLRPVANKSLGHAKEIAYYEEDFDNGATDWVISNAQGDLSWGWTNVGPSATSSTYPVPPLNSSTPSGWMMIDDDHDGTPGQNTESWLVSPVIDLSFTAEHVKLEFEQFFQEFDSDRTFVGISTNGGSSWSEVEVNEGVGRDGRPNPEMIDVDISEWLSSDRSHVLIRFRYVAVWDYGWQIDNIAVRDLPEHDMALLQAAITAYDFDNTGFEQIDYSIYPRTQLTPLLPSVTARNKGYAEATGVHATLHMEGPTGTTEYSSAPGSFAPAQVNTIAMEAYEPDNTLGTYAITFSIHQQAEDMVPTNNQRALSFAVSENIYAHDDGSVQAYQIQGPAQVDEAFEVGNHFRMAQDGSLTAVQVAVHANTPVGSTIYGALYLPATSAASHPTLIDLTANHTITATEVSAVGEALFITIPFATPIALEAGQTYLLVAGSSMGNEHVHFATSGTSAAQVSVIHYPTASAGFEFYITRTPMVRMQLAQPVGLAEASATMGTLSVAPNPVVDQAVLTIDVTRPGFASLRITDMAGKCVVQQDLGLLAYGNNRIAISAAALAPGLYHAGITMEGQTSGRRFVVER